MKRILYVLIAIFAVSFGVQANQSNLTSSLMSELCDPSDLNLGPISVIQGDGPNCEDYTFSVPAISGCEGINLNGFYTFVVTDAVGTTIAFVPYSPDLSISATLPSFGQYFVHVQYTYVDANGVSQMVTVSTDFDYQGCVTTPCYPSSLSLGPISVTEGVMFHCNDYTISVPPISGCPWTSLTGYYSFEVYDYANNLIGQNLNTQSTSFAIDLPYQAQFFVTVQYHYTDINGQSHTVTETTSFFYAGCNITAPTNLGCVEPNDLGDPQVLSWDVVSSAVSYDLRITINDPDCCPEGGPSVTFTNPQVQNYHTFGSSTDCFSWKVRSTASGGAKSDWSETKCSCEIKDVVSGGPRPKSMLETEVGQLYLSTVPNPALNYVDITLSGEFESPLNKPEMVMYDLRGKEVYRSDLTLYETKRIDLSSFESGVYLINTIDNGELLTTEKLVIE